MRLDRLSNTIPVQFSLVKTMEGLKALGASSILVLPIEKMME